MSLCKSNMYDDGYGWSHAAGIYANQYTPYLPETNRLQRAVYQANAVRAYPQDEGLHSHGGGYYEEPGMLEYAVGGVDNVYQEDAMSYEGPRGSVKSTRVITNSNISSTELANIVVETDAGPYLLSDNPELGEMARNEPDTDVEGGIIITSDDKALTLVSKSTVEAYNNGSVPPEIDRQFNEITMEETVTNRMSGVEGGDDESYYTPDISVLPRGEGSVSYGGYATDLSANVMAKIGGKINGHGHDDEKGDGVDHFTLPVYDIDEAGNMDMIHAGIRFSRRRRKFKRGRRGKSQSVKEARKKVMSRRRALKKKRKERSRLQKERQQLRKRREEIKKLKQRESKAEQELSAEEARFEREEELFRQETGTGKGPELPPRDEYHYYYSMGKYDSDERVEPKSITFTGKGEVTKDKPKESSHLGKRFHKSVWGLNDASYDLVESQALSYFKDYFGIPVEKATKGKDGVYRMGENFEISPYGIKSGIKMIAKDVQGFSDDAEEGAEVHEGGWKLTILKNAGLGGEFAGGSIKNVKADSVMKWGHWHITNQEKENSVHPRIVLHFESTKPVQMDDDHPAGEPIHEEYYVDYVDPVASDMFIHTGNAIRSLNFVPDEFAENKGFIKMTTHVDFDD